MLQKRVETFDPGAKVFADASDGTVADSVIFVQLPDRLPTHLPVGDDEEKATNDRKKGKLSSYPRCRVGKLVVRQSGKMFWNIDGVELEVTPRPLNASMDFFPY